MAKLMSQDVADLLATCQKFNVKHFKNSFLEVEFHQSAPLEYTSKAHFPTDPVPDPLPEDFKTDETMSYDKILNWSAGSDPSDIRIPDPSLPLTGDSQL